MNNVFYIPDRLWENVTLISCILSRYDWQNNIVIHAKICQKVLNSFFF